MRTQFKRVPGTKSYVVTNKGEIFNISREFKKVKKYKNKSGHPFVYLYNRKGKRIKLWVAAVVADAFLTEGRDCVIGDNYGRQIHPHTVLYRPTDARIGGAGGSWLGGEQTAPAGG